MISFWLWWLTEWIQNEFRPLKFNQNWFYTMSSSKVFLCSSDSTLRQHQHFLFSIRLISIPLESNQWVGLWIEQALNLSWSCIPPIVHHPLPQTIHQKMSTHLCRLGPGWHWTGQSRARLSQAQSSSLFRRNTSLPMSEWRSLFRSSRSTWSPGPHLKGGPRSRFPIWRA